MECTSLSLSLLGRESRPSLLFAWLKMDLKRSQQGVVGLHRMCVSVIHELLDHLFKPINHTGSPLKHPNKSGSVGRHSLMYTHPHTHTHVYLCKHIHTPKKRFKNYKGGVGMKGAVPYGKQISLSRGYFQNSGVAILLRILLSFEILFTHPGHTWTRPHINAHSMTLT